MSALTVTALAIIGCVVGAVCALAGLVWIASARELKRRRAVLELLSDGREWYGLDLVTASRGVLRRGTIYATLAGMEEEGFIVSRPESPLPNGAPYRRRLYRHGAYALTGGGRAAVRAKEK